MSNAFSERDKRSIAGRARTLLERLGEQDLLECREQYESECEQLFEAWRGTYPTDVSFDHRLEREGVTREECLQAICADKWIPDQPTPEWIDHLEELVEAVQQRTPQDILENPSQNWNVSGDHQANERIFGELSAAIAGYACDQLPDELADGVLSKTAIESLYEWFRRMFEGRFWRVPFAEFKGNVAAHEPDLATADPDEFRELPTEYYEEFLEYLFAGGFAELCREYPMYGRLLVTQFNQWEEQVRKFCTRLRSDYIRLANRFDVDGPLGEVVALEPLANDAFDDDRALMRVTFESGLTVVYKPRSVEIGATFYRVLDRLNDHLSTPNMNVPTYLVRDGYGWMEWVEYEERANEDAVKRYYRRAGTLICIAYFLGLIDCSVENLIVAGEQPVLIDVETVLQPYIRPDRRPVQSSLIEVVDDSVLGTGLLPYTLDYLEGENGPNQLATKLSGFGLSSDEAVLKGVTDPIVVKANTDIMTVERKSVSFNRSQNVPKVDGTDQPPRDYLAQIVEGFEQTYNTIVKLRDEDQLFEENGLFSDFEGVETCLLYRSWYRKTFKLLTSPESFHDGARFGLAMEWLAVPFCTDDTAKSPPWSLYDAERTALKHLKKPRFTCLTDELEIRMNGQRVGAKVDSTGLQRCRKRIASATSKDMHEQIKLIRECFD